MRCIQTHVTVNVPDSKVHVANMWPIWGRQDPGGPHVGHMNFAIWGSVCGKISYMKGSSTQKNMSLVVVN